jgi:hypothetical protein
MRREIPDRRFLTSIAYLSSVCVMLSRQDDIPLGKRCLGVFRGVQIVELIKPHLSPNGVS